MSANVINNSSGVDGCKNGLLYGEFVFSPPEAGFIRKM
jgi:hypothetical protein